MISLASKPLGRGSWTKMPSTWGSSFSAVTCATNARAGDIVREVERDGSDARLLARQPLVAHIHRGGRIRPHLDHREARSPPVRRREGRGSHSDLRAHTRGDSLAVPEPLPGAC